VDHPLLEKREIANTGVLIFTADRGLCGSYNSALLRRATELLREYDPARLRLFVVGRKGNAFFRRRGFNIVASPSVNSNVVSFGDAAEIAREVRGAFEKADIDELLVLYTKFFSPLTQKPTVIHLLPIEPPSADGAPTGEDYIFEPEPEALLRELLPRFLVNQVYQALLESVASEHGARMTSMSSATDNAGKMISTLTLSLNRARQASITKEISEIVGGAEALKG
jgi:F-type H+-transporting ATPase subunit gamma